MKIGITEAGDAGLDLSWSDKMDTVDGAIVITKFLNDKCIEKILEHQKKLIVHVTCTGYGGTEVEPNVPKWEWTHKQIERLVSSGFNPDKIVLRIDPIIPTQKGIAIFRAVYMFKPLPVKRVRISVLDMYPHVRARFLKTGLSSPYGESFSASEEQFNALDSALDEFHVTKFEACAEPRLKNAIQIGCVSGKDLELLGLKDNKNLGTGFQRRYCRCLGCKTELLSQKKQCANGCLYCYWR